MSYNGVGQAGDTNRVELRVASGVALNAPQCCPLLALYLSNAFL